MSGTKTQGAGQSSQALSGYGRLAWLLSTVAATALTAAPALAQQAPAPDATQVEEIVVTGSFATSLADALRIKRDAASITDSVSASDIGNFPAVNIAEALQRVPGVSISREAGEGQFVSVRGLGPNFQSVTLNGSPIAYNENIRNSDQSGRQFQFRVIPADLISAIVVAKAPTADLIDGGIGSNIDIQTAHALDVKPFVTARAFAHYENRSKESTPNGSISGAWRNADATFGVIAGLSYQTRDVQFDRFQHFGYTNRVINGQTVAVANDLVMTLEREERRRVSLMGGLEWKPSDKLSVTLDTLYSNFNNVIDEDRLSFELGGRSDFAARLAPGSAVIKNGVLYAGQINGGRINRNAEYSEQTHENLFVKLAADYEVAGWTISPALSYSKADSGLDTPLQRIDGRTADNPAGLVYSFAYGDDPVGDREIAKLQTNLDLTSPTAASYYRYRIRPTNSEDKDTTFLLNARRDFEARFGGVALETLRFGGQYTDRSRDYQRRDRVVELRPGTVVDASYTDQLLPSNVFNKTINSSFGTWRSYNRGKFGAAFIVPGEYDGTDPQSADLKPTGADLQQSYGVDEEVRALYGRADFTTSLGGKAVKGNLGLRWVSTDTLVKGTLLTATTSGTGAVTTVITPKEYEGSYKEFLPSANVTIDLNDNLLLRLAASRSLTRPSLADLRTATVPNSSLVSDVYERGQTAIDPATAAAWRGRRLIFQDAALSEVVAELARYTDTRMRIVDPALGRQRVTAIIPLDGPGSVVDRADRLLPIRLTRGGQGEVTVRAR
ncbi:TonB-dependent receptor [Caulobacter sp. AP07]|uniref:TonB-dependent receptor n=1 Tax=Caulobacter sp. AP07 TaxID=1144304 RepID=UPI0002720202|nr:TonB-dependent receptor [Caulobacter sp. AP07]EJL22128.1 TonB-dependent receptor [Caulobacter sp. AP07]